MTLFKCRGEVFFKKLVGLTIVFTLLFPIVTHAARPFVTDDAETVGKGGFQIELGIESSGKKAHEDGVKVKEKEIELSSNLTYGVMYNFDIILELPYSWKRTEENHITTFDKDRLSDITLQGKWRLLEKDGFGMTIKPEISLPTGDYKNYFGAGRATFGATFIISKELSFMGLHFNGAYRRNENKVEERKDIFSTSLALTVEPIKNLIIGGDIGISSNTCPKTKTAPAFFLLGGNYKIGKYITIDGGLKFGLNRFEVDHAIIGGMTVKF